MSVDHCSISILQRTIISALETLGRNYTGGYVPQCVLWETVCQRVRASNHEISDRALYIQFLTALSGYRNSFHLFESTEDCASNDLMWKKRESADNDVTADMCIISDRSTASGCEQIAALQEQLQKVRAQNDLLEFEIQKYTADIETLKVAASPEMQNSFYIYELLVNVVEHFDKMFQDSGAIVRRIRDKVLNAEDVE